jgi:hypothetical protein
MFPFLSPNVCQKKDHVVWVLKIYY